MNAELVTHVFASLQSIEKTVANVKKMLPGLEDANKDIIKVLPEQERIIVQMRRIANLLQLEAARNDWDKAVRSLKIFYGLHHMVRSDVLQAYARLSQKQCTQLTEFLPEGKTPICH
jgi:hypothetical protein